MPLQVTSRYLFHRFPDVVLSSYLKNDGSVKATSEQLFIHRNTVNYRLGKIEEITDMNLSSTSDRLQLTVGLMILHILT